MKFTIETSRRVVTMTPKAYKDRTDVALLPLIGYTTETYKSGIKVCDVFLGFITWYVRLTITTQPTES